MESTLSKYSLCYCVWQLNVPRLWSPDPHPSSPSILCLCLRNLPKLTKYHFNTNPLRQQQVICQESRFVKLFVVVSILKQKNYSIKFKSKNETNQPNLQPVTESWKVNLELICQSFKAPLKRLLASFKNYKRTSCRWYCTL